MIEPSLEPMPDPPTQPEPPKPDKPSLDTYTPPPSNWQPPADPPTDSAQSDVPQLHIDEEGTLSQIEESVHSPHIYENGQEQNTDAAREAVNEALKNDTSDNQPIESLNAQPLGPTLHPSDDQATQSDDSDDQASTAPPVPPPLQLPNNLPPNQ